MSQHLSLLGDGQAAEGEAKARTGLGKTDRPGSSGGLGNRGLWWNWEPTPQPKGRDWSPSTYEQARPSSIPTTGIEEGMREPDMEGVASHHGPVSCAGGGNVAREASIGVRIGQLLNSEITTFACQSCPDMGKATSRASLLTRRPRTRRSLRT